MTDIGSPTSLYAPVRRLAAVAATMAVFALSAPAQNAPRRLELADTARAAEPRIPSPPRRALVDTVSRGRGRPLLLGGAVVGRNTAFVRDQAFLGALVYAPSFATAVTNNPVSWAASYLVVAGGSFFAAAELSRDMVITEPMQHLATGAAVRGGLAGLGLGYAFRGDVSSTAGAIFLGSIAGTAGALIGGARLSDGEAAGALFGSDAGALTGFGIATMAGGARTGTNDLNRGRAAAAVAGMALGFPLGKAYAAFAPYRVTAGDVDALWTSAAVGSLVGWATVADAHPSDGATATALTLGGLAGIVVGDRLLVRPYDHSRADGQVLALGAVAGSLMGAGIGTLTGATHQRFNSVTAGFTAAGAIIGMALTEQYLGPHGAARSAVGRLEFDPAGAVATATRQPGSHSLLRWTF